MTDLRLTPGTCRDVAMQYAAAGVVIMPLRPDLREGKDGKLSPQPYGEWKITESNPRPSGLLFDQMSIVDFWHRFPDAQLGVLLGTGGLAAVDIDTRHLGPDGPPPGKPIPSPFPNAYCETTKSNGFHYLLRVDTFPPDDTPARQIGVGGYVDILWDGLLIVAPSAFRNAPAPYTMKTPGEVPKFPGLGLGLAASAQWLADEFRDRVKRRAYAPSNGNGEDHYLSNGPVPEAGVAGAISALIQDRKVNAVFYGGVRKPNGEVDRSETELQLAWWCYKHGLSPDVTWGIIQRSPHTKSPHDRRGASYFEKHVWGRFTGHKPAPPQSPSIPPVGTPSPTPTAPAATRDHLFTELGVRDYFVKEFGERVRYDRASGKWLVWNGTIWGPDDAQTIRGFVETVVDDITPDDPSKRVPCPPSFQVEGKKDRDKEWSKALHGWRRSMSTDRAFSAILRHAQVAPGIMLDPEAVDPDPWVLPVRDGLLDLKTGEIGPPRKFPVFTRGSPFRPDPSKACPKWEAFLAQFSGDDIEVRAFLQRVAYWVLTGDTSEQVVFDFWGPGGNGKTTFLETIAGLIPGFAVRADPRTFTINQNETVPNDLARMRGARLVLVSEPSHKKALNEDLIHRFTGGDIITARFLHQEYFDFRPAAKLVFYGSEKLRVDGQSKATWRRMIFVTALHEVPDKERIKDLHRILLQEEGDAILNWALQGRESFQIIGLCPPTAVTQATEDFKLESDTLAEFLSECVNNNAGPVSVSATDLHRALVGWANGAGEVGLSRLSMKALSTALKERGFKNKKATKGMYWTGVDLTQNGRNFAGQKALPEETFGKENWN